MLEQLQQRLTPAAMADWLAAPTPRIAVEVAADRVVVARGGPRGTLLQAEGRPLASGIVQPSPTRSNLSDGAALTRLLQQMLTNLECEVGAEATLLTPDITARIFVLDFDTLPARTDELDALVRFRLRKSLPFDVEGAAIGCQVTGRDGGGGGRVLAAVADRARLDEYEACLEAAGAHPAVVIPSGLACLSAHPALAHGTLMVRAEPGSLTTAYCRNGLIEFYRVMEVDAEPECEDIVPSAAYFRDHFQADATQEAGAPGAALFAAGLQAATVSRLRAELPWAEFRELEVRADGGEAAAGHLLAVVGALQGRFA